MRNKSFYEEITDGITEKLKSNITDQISKQISNIKIIKDLKKAKSNMTKQITKPLEKLSKKYIDPQMNKIEKKIKKKFNIRKDYNMFGHMRKIVENEDMNSIIKERIDSLKNRTLIKVASRYKKQLGNMSYKLVKGIGKITKKDLKKQAKIIAKITKEMTLGKYTKLKNEAGKLSKKVVRKSVKYIGKLRNKDYSKQAKTLGKIAKEMVHGKYNTLKGKLPSKFPKVTKLYKKIKKATHGKYTKVISKVSTKFPKLFKGSKMLTKVFKKSFIPVLGHAENLKTIADPNGSEFLKALATTDMALDATQVIPGVGTVLSTVGSAANFAGSVFYETAPDWLKKKLDTKTKDIKNKAINTVKNVFSPDQFNKETATIKNRGKKTPNMAGRRSNIGVKSKSKVPTMTSKSNVKGFTQVSGTNIMNLYNRSNVSIPKPNHSMKSSQANLDGTKIIGPKVDNSIKNQNKYDIHISGVNKSTTEIMNELLPKLKEAMSNQPTYA
ncbi:hypothetical protein [Crassaminicella profunda]|uniref:hypothetical protein n=1 Tax=Crassaminicella profunda TaxID=1286698 RepID=UPI001CA75CDA|nr:hypothetical protein [Crassaminicella profunda]QZY55090.1 hypothetical protein K7H06_19140 [Crassaminicella profunda]